jgi:hypothetical protein
MATIVQDDSWAYCVLIPSMGGGANAINGNASQFGLSTGTDTMLPMYNTVFAMDEEEDDDADYRLLALCIFEVFSLYSIIYCGLWFYMLCSLLFGRHNIWCKVQRHIRIHFSGTTYPDQLFGPTFRTNFSELTFPDPLFRTEFSGTLPDRLFRISFYRSTFPDPLFRTDFSGSTFPDRVFRISFYRSTIPDPLFRTDFSGSSFPDRDIRTNFSGFLNLSLPY